MPVETFNYLDSLNASNPVSTDGQAQGDDHIRGIKAVLKATFPNITGPVTLTHTALNDLGAGNIKAADGSSGAPTITFASDGTAGFYKVSTGVTGIAGRLTGDGACPTGMIADFPTTTVPSGWYYANGQALPRTGATAALFALLGTTYGIGNGTTTFNVPNTNDRYRRSHGTYSAGTFLADSIKTHVSSLSASAPDHLHNVAGNCAFSLASEIGFIANGGGGGGTVSNVLVYGATGASLSVNSGSINFNVTSGGSDRPLTVSGTATYSGDVETRPVTFVVSTCIKA
jgi:microcystin-dependent protein